MRLTDSEILKNISLKLNKAFGPIDSLPDYKTTLAHDVSPSEVVIRSTKKLPEMVGPRAASQPLDPAAELGSKSGPASGQTKICRERVGRGGLEVAKWKRSPAGYLLDGSKHPRI